MTNSERPWWSMSVAEVAHTLDVDPDQGLTVEAAAERIERFGRNELRQHRGPTLLRRFADQFTDPLVGLLLIAILISLGAWWSRRENSIPVEALVIGVIVVANAVIGVWQQGKATRAVDALRRLSAAHTTVVRDGRTSRLPTSSIVPGDVVLLAEGDLVGFDGRLVEAASVEVNEASLTGESVPVEKSTAPLDTADGVSGRSNMVLSGTSVVRGRGRAIAVATANDTEVGRIATLLDETEGEPSPLQRQIQRLGRTLGIAVVCLAVIVVVSILVTSDVDTAQEAFDALLVAVSLAVAAIPEGLPAIMTVVLALGVQRMSHRNAIVKRLLSVETLGSASVICTDKTGTLTRNEMTVLEAATSNGLTHFSGVGYQPGGSLESDVGVDERDVDLLLRAGALANDARLERVDGRWSVSGDPTEIALLVAADKVGPDDRTLGPVSAIARLDEVPFDSDRKLMSVLVGSDGLAGATGENGDEHRAVQFTKGAPDILLDRCVGEWSAGVARPLDEPRRQAIRSRIETFADEGLRTLAIARRDHSERPSVFDADHENELVWLGIVGISDPPRAEAKDVIERAHRAGIRTVMVTGDHPRTAASIGASLGLEQTGEPVTGSDLGSVDWTDEDAVATLVESTDVFARVAPEHKLRLVRAIQRSGHIVAMTGDGVNDAPALRQADIGVAMGGVGTDVAREAADMVLTDDDFATIVTAIEEGRNIFADIRKFLRYLLASNAGEVLVMVIGVLAAGALGLRVGEGLAVPLLATQILWINLLTDSALALALGVDPSVDDVMADAPRRLDDPIVDGSMWVTIVLVGVTSAIAGLVALDLELAGGLLGGDGDVVTARTMLFTTIVLAQIFNAFNARSDRVSAFVKMFDNRLLWAAVALTAVLQVAVVHVEFLNRSFDTTPLTAVQWLICWGLASTVLVVDEVRKVVVRLAHERRTSSVAVRARG